MRSEFRLTVRGARRIGVLTRWVSLARDSETNGYLLSGLVLPRPEFDSVDRGVRSGGSDRVRPIRFPDPAHRLIADRREQGEEVSAPEANRSDRKDQLDSECGIVGHRREAVIW